MQKYKLWEEGYSERITVIQGDLSQSFWGIAPPLWDKLAHSIDIIYHNGALVNFANNYDTLRAPNVQSVVDILHLAERGKKKHINYISSMGVFPKAKSDKTAWKETDIADVEDISDAIGYTQSKWVAENILIRARSRGFSIIIHRPSRIAFNADTYEGNNDDLLNILLKHALEFNIFPAYQEATEDNIVNVDYVSKAITTLSLEISSYGKNYHIINKHGTPISFYYEALKACNGHIKTVPPEDFFNSFKESNNHNVQVLVKTNDSAKNDDQGEENNILYCYKQTESTLKKYGIVQRNITVKDLEQAVLLLTSKSRIDSDE